MDLNEIQYPLGDPKATQAKSYLLERGAGSVGVVPAGTDWDGSSAVQAGFTASAPPAAAVQVGLGPPEFNEAETANGPPHWGIAIFSLLFVGVGGLIVAQALGLGEFVGRSLVPNWVLGLAGLVFLLPGLGLLLRSLGFGEAGSRFAGSVAALALAAIFHYTVFGADLSGWSGPSLGPLSAGEVVRIAVVTIDLMALFAWIYSRSGSVDERAVPLVERTNALDPSARKMLAVRMLGVPLVIALLLHFTGVLDRIGFLLTQERGSGASSSAAMPTRSLSAYAGWWGDAHTPFGPGWVTRVIVRVDGDAAHVSLWSGCPPNHCPEGEFKANVRGRSPHGVEALEVSWKQNGLSRQVVLSPNGSDPNLLSIAESRIRGQDRNTQQSSFTGIKRVK